MSYILGTGWWTAWYLLLWTALAPFLWLAVPLARTPLGRSSPGLDLAFGLCNLGLALLLLTSLVSTVLWAVASPGGIVHRFLWPLAAYVFGGSLAAAGLYAVLYYVTAYAGTVADRWGCYIALLAGVSAAHFFALHAAWRFRTALPAGA